MKALPHIKPSGRNQPIKLWPFVITLAAIIGLGLAVFTFSAWLLWLGLDRPQLDTSKPLTTKDQLDLVRIALIITGGLGGVVALVVAYRKQRLAEDDNRRENTKLFNERFATASGQLGHDSAAVRLAGVYAMASLADDWNAGRQTCIDVLCAYIRMPYQPDRDQPGWKEGEHQVRLSIISIIRDHHLDDTSRTIPSWQGHHFDLTRATFDGGDFSGANFAESIFNFSGARFCSGVVHFIGSTFTRGLVTFTGSTVDGTLNFASAKFSGGFADFSDMTLSGGTVGFLGATFSGGEVDFRNATLSGTLVYFHFAKFSGGEVDFRYAKFSGGTVDLSAVQDFTKPPIFDSWTEPPSGLMLPSATTEINRPGLLREDSTKAAEATRSGVRKGTTDDDNSSLDRQPATEDVSDRRRDRVRDEEARESTEVSESRVIELEHKAVIASAETRRNARQADTTTDA